MAFKQEITDRCKAVGFFRHVEWKKEHGVLVKVYEPNEYGDHYVSFEIGSHDVEYDQRIDNYRQFFLTRQETLKFMLNAKFNLMKIAKLFKQIDGCQVVQEKLE